MTNRVLVTIDVNEASRCEELSQMMNALQNLLLVIADNPEIKAEFFPQESDCIEVQEKQLEVHRQYVSWWDEITEKYQLIDDRQRLHLDFNSQVISLLKCEL